MEIFELRYFIAVANCENINQAALKVGVSPGSLSKAITRLEVETGVKLFAKFGRNIQLTNEHFLRERPRSPGYVKSFEANSGTLFKERVPFNPQQLIKLTI